MDTDFVDVLFATEEPQHIMEPYKRLLFAVLERSVDDLGLEIAYPENSISPSVVERIGKNRLNMSRSIAWFLRTDRSDYFASFENICDVFGINANSVRKRIKPLYIKNMGELNENRCFNTGQDRK